MQRVEKLRIKILGIFLLFLILLKPLAAVVAFEPPESNELVVIGTAKITGGNEAADREEAINDALKKGVEAYLIKRIGSRGMINNFQKAVHDLIPKAKELVDNFFILSEARFEKELRILVRMRLNENLVARKINESEFILSEGPPCKVLFLIGQLGPQPGEKIYWWQDLQHPAGPNQVDTYFAKLFEESGLQSINRFSQTIPQDFSPEMSGFELSEDYLRKWGNLFSADVVVHGQYEATAYKEVIVSLSAFDVKKGSSILKDDLVEKGLEGTDMTQLTEKAVYKISRRMAPLIIKSFEAQGIKTQTFEVTINGLKSFKQFRELKEFLEKKVKGTQSVKQTGAKGDSISVLVEYSGDAQKYLNQIANQQSLSFKFAVEKVSENKLIFTIR